MHNFSNPFCTGHEHGCRSYWECRSLLLKSRVSQPPMRAYMDDLTVPTSSVPGSRWILQGLERLIKWARMSFKPAKSRTLVLKKGKVTDKFHFMLEGTPIPSISEKPVKSLGKLFDHSLWDTVAIQSSISELETCLNNVDQSGLPGKFKCWIYQHGILPRILWPLLVYEVPITSVELMERTVGSYLRRWLGLPRSLSTTALYGRITPCSSLSAASQRSSWFRLWHLVGHGGGSSLWKSRAW